MDRIYSPISENLTHGIHVEPRWGYFPNSMGENQGTRIVGSCGKRRDTKENETTKITYYRITKIRNHWEFAKEKKTNLKL